MMRTLLAVTIAFSVFVGALSGVARADAPTRTERLDKLYRRAQFQVRKRLFRDAIDTYREVLELDPQNADTYFNIVSVGRAMHRCGPIVRYAPGFLALEGGSAERRDVAGSYRRCLERMEDLATLTIDCPVKGAQIRVGSALYGFAPVAPIRLPRGRYEIRVDHELYEPYRQEIRIGPSEEKTHVVKPVARVFYGELMVDVEPGDGVMVYLDDELLGTTPFSEPKRVRTGRYLLRLELPGWDKWVRYVTIERDKMYALDAALEQSDPDAVPPAEPPPMLRR